MTTPRQKIIWIGSDHAGFELKKNLILKLNSEFAIEDLGTHSLDSVDYPDYANLVSEKVKNQTSTLGFGLLICGSGQGMAMRANKFPWVRAALGWNPEIVQLSREHNNANILCLGSRFTSLEQALHFVQIFNVTTFSEGRHLARVAKVSSSL